MAILNKEGIDRIIHKKDRLAEENLWGMLSKIRECKEGIIDFLDTKNELHRVDMSEAFNSWMNSNELKLKSHIKDMHIDIDNDSIFFYLYGGKVTNRKVGIRYYPKKDEFEFSLKYISYSCIFNDVDCKTFIIKDFSDINNTDFKERYTTFEYTEMLDSVSNGLKSFLNDFQKWIYSIDKNVIDDEEKSKPHLNFFTIIIKNWLKL